MENVTTGRQTQVSPSRDELNDSSCTVLLWFCGEHISQNDAFKSCCVSSDFEKIKW